jgi:hypothetical protein
MTQEHTQENNVITRDGQNIGKLLYSPHDEILRLDVTSDDYREAIISVIDSIIEQGQFEVEFDREKMEIKNAPPLLHQAVKQEALNLLGILTI